MIKRHPNPNYHKHECDQCGGISECFHPSCRGQWYYSGCHDCFQEHLDEASAIVAKWPEWKRNIHVLGSMPTSES